MCIIIQQIDEIESTSSNIVAKIFYLQIIIIIIITIIYR